MVAATTSQTKQSTGLTFTDALCLFGPLMTFLGLLGWATWEMRLANPMAFVMVAGLKGGRISLGDSRRLVTRIRWIA